MLSGSPIPPVLPPPQADAGPDGPHTEVATGRWSIPASVVLHGLVLAALLTLVDARRPEAPREISVNVEIVMLAPSPAAPEEPAELAATPRVPRRLHPRRTTAPVATPPMVKPSRMLSETVLADPRSLEARQIIDSLLPVVRMEQICGIEAMAQVDAWDEALQPDRVVAYATADTTIAGNTFTADGAAIHARHEWYAFRFACETTPDRRTVVAFTFAMGDPIPREHWEEYSLADGAGPLD